MSRDDVWDPQRYERYKKERAQPFFDLIELVEKRPALRVLDIGCGTGELTRTMHEKLEASSTIGIDSSEAMLEKSKAFSSPGLTFRQSDIDTFEPTDSFDLIVSNACLHWVEDHRRLFTRITSWLADDGQLAVQVPANHDQPTHTVAGEVASESPFREELDGFVRESPVLTVEEYAVLLSELGFERQHARMQIYPHMLESKSGMVDWVRGTFLTAYEERLSKMSYESFLDRYRERLLAMYADTRPFFFPFKRTLLWGTR